MHQANISRRHLTIIFKFSRQVIIDPLRLKLLQIDRSVEVNTNEIIDDLTAFTWHY